MGDLTPVADREREGAPDVFELANAMEDEDMSRHGDIPDAAMDTEVT